MRNLILAVIILLFYYLVKSFFTPKNTLTKKNGPIIDDEMVKDPNCGVYIPKKEATEKKIKGEKHFFCSKECYEEYKNKTES